MAESARTLFDSVPKEDKLNLYARGQLNAKKVVEILKYKKKDVSVATDVPQKSIRYDNKMPEALRERLTEWAVAINLVGSFFNDEHKTVLWFQTINPLLGNVSPKAMIRAGRFKKLLKFIQTALDENNR
jgi:hypothetical protein